MCTTGKIEKALGPRARLRYGTNASDEQLRSVQHSQLSNLERSPIRHVGTAKAFLMQQSVRWSSTLPPPLGGGGLFFLL